MLHLCTDSRCQAVTSYSFIPTLTNYPTPHGAPHGTPTHQVFGWLMEKTNGRMIPTFRLAEEPTEPPVREERSEYIADYKADEKGGPVDWTPFVMGFIPHLFCWAVIACYFFTGVSRGDPPGFVWAVIFIVFFLDLLFAINQWLQFLQVGGCGSMERWHGMAWQGACVHAMMVCVPHSELACHDAMVSWQWPWREWEI